VSGFKHRIRSTTVIAVAVLAFQVTPALAAEVGLSDFYGRWVGEGVAETEVGEDTERQSRGLEVIVRAHPVGFQLCWSTIRREPGEPDRQSFAMMLFEPTAQHGHWTATFSADGSASLASADAVLNGDTIRVTNRATNENGETEVQVYERSLRRGAMELYFTRHDDGRLARIVQGRLEPVTRRPGEPAPWC